MTNVARGFRDDNVAGASAMTIGRRTFRDDTLRLGSFPDGVVRGLCHAGKALAPYPASRNYNCHAQAGLAETAKSVPVAHHGG